MILSAQQNDHSVFARGLRQLQRADRPPRAQAPDLRTRHAALPVEDGWKQALNLWVLERPFEYYRTADE